MTEIIINTTVSCDSSKQVSISKVALESFTELATQRLIGTNLASSLTRCNDNVDAGSNIVAEFFPATDLKSAKSQWPIRGPSKVPLTQTPMPLSSPDSREHQPQFGSSRQTEHWLWSEHGTGHWSGFPDRILPQRPPTHRSGKSFGEVQPNFSVQRHSERNRRPRLL